MNILIVNLHSALNLGDEAIMQQTITLLKKKYPGSNITLMANHPESWKVVQNVNITPSLIHYIQNIDNVIVKLWRLIQISFDVLFQRRERWFRYKDDELREIYFLINDADLVLSAGGGNFYANTFIGRDFILNVFLLMISGLLNKTIIMLPQSFGPVRSRFQMTLLKKGLSFAKKIYVREEQSYMFLNKIGIDRRILQRLPDLALMQHIDPPKLDQNKNILKIGVTIIDRGAQNKRFKSQETYQLAFIDLIRETIAYTNAEVYIFVQCYGPSKDQNDSLISTNLYNQFYENTSRVHLLKDYKNSKDFLVDLAKMDIFISSRMHSAIFAIVTRVPSILIGYQPKSRGLYDLFDLEKYFIDMGEIHSKSLYSLSMDLFDNRKKNSEQVSSFLKKYQTDIMEAIIKDKW